MTYHASGVPYRVPNSPLNPLLQSVRSQLTPATTSVGPTPLTRVSHAIFCKPAVFCFHFLSNLPKRPNQYSLSLILIPPIPAIASLLNRNVLQAAYPLFVQEGAHEVVPLFPRDVGFRRMDFIKLHAFRGLYTFPPHGHGNLSPHVTSFFD